MTQEISRTAVLMDVSADFAEVERLRLVNAALKRHLDETLGQISILKEEEISLVTAITANSDLLRHATQRIDNALSGLYHVTVVPESAPIQTEKKGRGKAKDKPVVQEVQEVQEQELSPENLYPFKCQHCDDAYASEQFLADHMRSEHKVNTEVSDAAAAQETKAEGVGTGEAQGAQDADAGAALPVVEEVSAAEVAELEKTAATFMPLDEPLGDCEICMGYGVIEGELYGEPALLPCTCPAGLKVKGEEPKSEPTIAKCCEDCNIDNPDCAACFMPDMEAQIESGAELARCASGPCTATGKNAKDVCLRVGTPKRPAEVCRNFVAVGDCAHNPFKQTTQPDGSITCDLCDLVVKSAPAPQGNLQSRCSHPKPFRQQTPEGVKCKVCSTIIDQPELPNAA